MGEIICKARLISEIDTELFTLNKEKTNNSILKQVKAQNTHLTKEEIQMVKKHMKRRSTS